jgi:hypothetical protein
MDQVKIISYAMQEVLRRWDHENNRTKNGSYIDANLVRQYGAEYEELKAMLLKAGEEVKS